MKPVKTQNDFINALRECLGLGPLPNTKKKESQPFLEWGSRFMGDGNTQKPKGFTK